VFDIGLGEIILLAVIGLLVFGPEKLPKAAADAARTIRNLRAMATSARKDLADSAGLDLTEAQDAVRQIADLHPKRMVAGFLGDDDPRPANAPKPTGEPSAPEASRARFDPDAT
jgi:sec-independent protein translocase protein TatB